jgi:hypothetical protein
LGSKNRQKLEMDYVEYLGDAVKIWSQTNAEKLSKFGAKNGVKIWVKTAHEPAVPEWCGR